MKNLKKISRDGLKTIKGGITEECARAQAAATACYTTLAACQADPNSTDPDFSNSLCIRYCNKFCY